MKKNHTLIILCLLLTQCSYELTKTEELHCNCNIEDYKKYIQTITNADSVLIYKKYLQEEIYFKKMIFPTIVIINPTTEVLDFKSLPIVSPFHRFENYQEIESGLKEIGFSFAKKILECCNLSGCNDVVVEFFRYDDHHIPRYQFMYHYPELLEL